MQSSPWGLAKARLANKSSEKTPCSRCHLLPWQRTRSESALRGKLGAQGKVEVPRPPCLIYSLHPAPLAALKFRRFFFKGKKLWIELAVSLEPGSTLE